ncbi:hypothetical protein FHS05_001040 [Microbacterium endophyticum]|uniref:hypothetical protein n=1 Tax=Microbacterium endophyticum TaxID=1526412 RepID=UPI0013EB9E1C|nr:hypothetical protein [Microbacterium endophyticum]NIK36015.1 hypothetical protein [Microbacterium endophyticum]
MLIELESVAKGRRMRALPETSVTYSTGHAVLACAETEQRPTVLGLIASGRMRPSAGYVTIDGSEKTRDLRRRVALIDAPDVCDPHPDVLTAGVVSEELMFAGRRSSTISAVRWLRAHDMGDIAFVPFGNISPTERVRILCELAVLRAGVEGFVLVSPDRHGGRPGAWWEIAEEFAERGLAVLVIAGQAAAEALEAVAEKEVGA